MVTPVSAPSTSRISRGFCSTAWPGLIRSRCCSGMAVDLRQSPQSAILKISAKSGDRWLRAKFVIGCDGGASRVRDMLGSKLVGSTYAQRWLVVDTIANNHDLDEISFYCD